MTSQEVDEFAYELKIPKERVAVLIGKKGELKRQLEHVTKTKIKVDSDEGDVSISGADALLLYSCREIVRAIGRGFNPQIAMQLLKQDYGIEFINLTEYASTQKELERLRGRVIGEGGKSRKTIEDLTFTNISVYGKTIGIIGRLEGIPAARKAVEALLSGRKHGTVYKFLERNRKQMRLAEQGVDNG
ncbi:MAG: KH domain-containing protein [Candidatus Woesearchaeota archaeon]